MRDPVTVSRLPLALFVVALGLAACTTAEQAASSAEADAAAAEADASSTDAAVAGTADEASDAAADEAGLQKPPRVSYHFDGSDAQLEHVKRLAGYYCEDRYQKNAGLVRTTKGNDGFAQAVYKCI